MQVGTIFYCNVFLNWRNYPPKLFFHYACGNSLKSKIAFIKEKKSFVQCCSSVQHILIVDDANPPVPFLFLTSHPLHHQQTVSHRLSLSAILMKWALVTLCTYSQAILFNSLPAAYEFYQVHHIANHYFTLILMFKLFCCFLVRSEMLNVRKKS